MENLFAVLGLGVDATAAEVHAAFRSLAMKWHPDRRPDLDRNPGEPQGEPHAATEAMTRINGAYAVLKVKAKREEHRNALQAHWNANRNGLGAVLSDKGWVMPGAHVRGNR